MKKCFKCKANLPLTDYDENRAFNLKSDLGKCRVCKRCNLKRAIERLGVVDYDVEMKKFSVVNFENESEVKNWFKINGKL